MGNTIQNTSVRIVSVLSGTEMDKISEVGLRDVDGLFHLVGESEITQNELTNLGNRKIVANMEEKEKTAQIQETKEKGRAD